MLPLSILGLGQYLASIGLHVAVLLALLYKFPGLLGIVGGAINAVLEEQEATIHQRETSEKEEVEIQRSNDLAEERHDELAKKVDARMTRIEVRMSSLMRAMRGTASGGIRSPDKTWVGEDALPPAARSPPTGAVHSFDASVGRQRDEKVVKLEKEVNRLAAELERLAATSAPAGASSSLGARLQSAEEEQWRARLSERLAALEESGGGIHAGVREEVDALRKSLDEVESAAARKSELSAVASGLEAARREMARAADVAQLREALQVASRSQQVEAAADRASISEKLAAEVAAVRATVAALQEDVTALSERASRVPDLESRAATISDAVSSLQAAPPAPRPPPGGSRGASRPHSPEMDASGDQVRALERDLANAVARISAVEAAASLARAPPRALQDLAVRVGAVEEAVATQGQRVTALEGRAGAADTRAASSEGRVGALAARTEALEGAASRVREAAEAAVGEARRHGAAVEQLRVRVEEQVGAVDTGLSGLKSMDGRLTVVERKVEWVQDVEQRLGVAEGKAGRVGDLERRVSDLEKKGESTGTEQRPAEWEDKWRALEGRVARCESSAADGHSRVKSFTREVHSLREKVERVEKAKDGPGVAEITCDGDHGRREAGDGRSGTLGAAEGNRQQGVSGEGAGKAGERGSNGSRGGHGEEPPLAYVLDRLQSQAVKGDLEVEQFQKGKSGAASGGATTSGKALSPFAKPTQPSLRSTVAAEPFTGLARPQHPISVDMRASEAGNVSVTLSAASHSARSSATGSAAKFRHGTASPVVVPVYGIVSGSPAAHGASKAVTADQDTCVNCKNPIQGHGARCSACGFLIFCSHKCKRQGRRKHVERGYCSSAAPGPKGDVDTSGKGAPTDMTPAKGSKTS